MRKGFMCTMTLQDGESVDVFVPCDEDVEVEQKQDVPVLQRKLCKDEVLREIKDAKKFLMEYAPRDEQLYDVVRQLCNTASLMAWRFLDNE
jgi:hypothetical protein